MKRSYPWALLAFSLILFSCKKFIQKQEENAVLKIMTTGLWHVSGYKQNDTDITSSFSGYLFKFDANNTVTGTKDNVSAKGQWSADIANRAIIANFPGTADPLVLLNYTWTIKDSYTDSVSAWAIDTVKLVTNTLQLKK